MTEKLDILVVEDKPRHQESARILLGNQHNLRIAKKYSEAIKAINEQRPNVLLTDMMFPLGEGPTQDTYGEAPLGYALALYASRPHIAIPRIALLSDLNHHSNAVSATFDKLYVNGPVKDITEPYLGGFRYPDSKESQEVLSNGRPVFRINSSSFVMFDERDLKPELYMLNGKIGEYNSFSKDERNARGFFENQVKDWKAALEQILQVSP